MDSDELNSGTEPAAAQESEASAQASAQAEQQQQPQEGAGKQPAWEVRRIATLTRKAAEAERRALLAETRLRELQESARQVAAEAGGEAAASSGPAASDAALEREFQMRLAAAVQEQQFNSTCNAIYQQGSAEFSDFNARLDTLKATGAMTPEVVLTAHEVGDAHKLLAALADEPELAERLPTMTMPRMAVELQKLRDKLTRPKAPSKAPAPPDTIKPGGVAEQDPEKMPVADYVKWRKAQLAQARR